MKEWVIGFVLLVLLAFGAIEGGRIWSVRQAESAAEAAVLERLVSPATARFANVSVRVREGGYVVAGEVDAQNRMGALVRSSFAVRVSKKGNVVEVDLREC